MSLIDEALKRARLEAAQRAAESEGLPYPTIPRHLAPPRRRRWLAPAAVALAVIAGLVVGLLVASRAGSRPDRLATAGAGGEPVTSGPATPAQVKGDLPAAAPDPTEPEGDAASGPPVSEPVLSEPTPREPSPAAEPVTSGPRTPAELVRDPVTPETPSAETPSAETPSAETSGDLPDEGAAARGRIGRRAEAPPPTDAPAGDDDSPPGPLARPARTDAPPPPTAEPTARAVRSPAPPTVEPTPAPPVRAATPPPDPQVAASTVTDPDSGVLLVLPGRPERDGAAEGLETEPATPIESHVQRFPLPDGGAIELGGIAWSETGPFALINGRVIGPGSAIGDYVLETIQQGHVELVGDGRRVLLSLQ